jgi:hypothetical protein
VTVEFSQIVRAKLDRIYDPKLARCAWESHKPLLIAQRNRLEDLILTVLETVQPAE